MKKGNLTREQAIAAVGLQAVEKLDRANCDFTNRVGYNGTCQGDEEVEFSTSAAAENTDGYDVRLVAYYYQDADAVDDSGDDLSSLEWEIAGYEVI